MVFYHCGMPDTHTTHQLRCHIRKSGHARLGEVRGMLNTLYNAALQERRDAYRMAGKSINLYQQNAALTTIRADWPEWAALDVSVGRGVLRRLDRAFNAFFRRVKEGGAPGFPRFKPLSRFRCIELAGVRPGMVKGSADERKAHIRVKGLPPIELRLKRPLPPSGSLKSLRLVQRANGYLPDAYSLTINDHSLSMNICPTHPASRAAARLGLHPQTLRRYARQGKIPLHRNSGSQRLYDVDSHLQGESDPETVCCCRVTSAKQRGHLQRQVAHMREIFPEAQVITDIAGELNWNRKGPVSLLERLHRGDKLTLVAADRDRLAGFGFELFQWLVE